MSNYSWDCEVWKVFWLERNGKSNVVLGNRSSSRRLVDKLMRKGVNWLLVRRGGGKINVCWLCGGLWYMWKGGKWKCRE